MMKKRWLVFVRAAQCSLLKTKRSQSRAARWKAELRRLRPNWREVGGTECDLQQKSCSRLTPGDYLMLRLKTEAFIKTVKT